MQQGFARKRSAFITGASSGIGAAVARDLARHGFNLALVARRSELLDQVGRECIALGAEVLQFQVDLALRSDEALSIAIEETATKFGGLDSLINNAGTFSGGSVDSLDLLDAARVFEVNVLASLRTTRHAATHLKASASGSVIFISSVAGHLSFAGSGIYCASKHALNGLAGSVFEDLREYGIKVSSICPGYVNTSMPSANLDAKKMIQPDDVAHTVRFIIDFPATGCPTESTHCLDTF